MEAARLVLRCLDEGRAMDGIVCLGDRLAMGAVNALSHRGVKVGSEVRVIGMDDTLFARVSNPSVSSVQRNTEIAAQRAVEALLAMMSGHEAPADRITIPHQVVERESTLGARGADWVPELFS